VVLEAAQTSQAGSTSPGAPGRCSRTFKPQRLEIGTWKSNVSKNAGKVVKFRCTFDKLMDKYKKEKVNSLNQPLKKESDHYPSKMCQSKLF
jgi:hypothetical protein